MGAKIIEYWRQVGTDKIVLLYGATVMVSAVLLFAVQPMFSKMVLPLLGGAPAVWNTAMMFFQGALLLGYAYAHFLTRWFRWRYQVGFHLGLMLLAVLALPIAPMLGWLPPASEFPVFWLVGLFSVSIGLPFFAIAANAPLLQRWFASSDHPLAPDPYFLYAASNFASISALLAYPVLIEPMMGLRQQSLAWSAGYGLLFVLIALCTIRVRSTADTRAMDTAGVEKHTQGMSVTWRRRLHWIALAFVPSSLLLGVTANITTDIAATPFIWVLPLTLYLLSFVLVFSRRTLLKPSWMITTQAYFVTIVAITMWGAAGDWFFYLLLHLCTFFVCAMVCHGELAKLRPVASELTAYYFFMAFGGLLGGVFNALLAPMIFDAVIEYPFALVLACFLRPSEALGTRSQLVLDVLLPIGVLIAVVVTAAAFGINFSSAHLSRYFPLIVIVGVILFSFRKRPLRFGLGIAAGMLMLSFVLSPHNILERERSFFGVHWVQAAAEGRFNVLWNGTTEHGAQSTNPALWREPLSYYHRDGPFGEVFTTYAKTPISDRIGVVGLGAGALACYRRPGQEWTFFEIDPVVVALAKSAGFFHYLSTCASDSAIVLGDARLSLRSEPDKRFGILVIDAFSSDAIPVHLLTREAMALYLAKLRRDGLLVFHISNRHLNLEPVLAALAQDAGVTACTRVVRKLPPRLRENRKRAAQVVVVARSENPDACFGLGESWRLLPASQAVPVWTDDYSNLLGVLKK